MNLSRDDILQVIESFKKYKETNRQTLMQRYVQQRVQDSVRAYYKEMKLTAEALASYNSLKVLKKLNKELK